MDSQGTATITEIPLYVCRFYAQSILAPYTPSKHFHLNDENGNQFQNWGLKQPLPKVFMIETNEQFLRVGESAIVLTCLRFG